MNLTPQQVARKIAAAASDKKARDIFAFKHGKPFALDRLFYYCQRR